MATDVRTACYGFTLRVTRDVTWSDLLDACSALNALLPYSSFEPEKVAEGGILFTAWPVIGGGRYKSFRLEFDDYPGFQEINEVPMDTVILHRIRDTMKVRTLLKAFGGAPAWTRDEVKAFADVLECTCGLVPLKTSFPLARDLKNML